MEESGKTNSEKHYYVQIEPPEAVDTNIYYTEDDFEYDHIWVGGNRDFSTMNEDMVDGLIKKLDECGYDLNNIEETDNNSMDEIISTLDYYFPPESFPRQKNTLKKLYRASVNYYDGQYQSGDEVNALVCKLLEMQYGEPFEFGTISGYSQGDWAEIIYPESKKHLVDFIEAVYMGTGTAFQYTLEKYSEPPDFSEVDVEGDYISGYKDVKSVVAENLNCSEDEIIVLEDE